MELVDHERFESISNGVQIVQPAEPWLHVACRNCKSGVDDQSQNPHRRRRQSLRESAGRSSNRPENTRHGESRDEGEDPKCEECAGLSTQIAHEVEREIECNRDKDLGRKVAYHGCHGLGAGVVQSELSMLLNNWALGIQRQDLGTQTSTNSLDHNG